MLRQAVRHGRLKIAQRWLESVIVAGDPADLIPKAAVEHLAFTLAASGAEASPPFLGGESEPGQLVHVSNVCQFCNERMNLRPSHKAEAVILDVTGPLKKQHVLRKYYNYGSLRAPSDPVWLVHNIFMICFVFWVYSGETNSSLFEICVLSMPVPDISQFGLI